MASLPYMTDKQWVSKWTVWLVFLRRTAFSIRPSEFTVFLAGLHCPIICMYVFNFHYIFFCCVFCLGLILGNSMSIDTYPH